MASEQNQFTPVKFRPPTESHLQRILTFSSSQANAAPFTQQYAKCQQDGVFMLTFSSLLITRLDVGLCINQKTKETATPSQSLLHASFHKRCCEVQNRPVFAPVWQFILFYFTFLFNGPVTGWIGNRSHVAALGC